MPRMRSATISNLARGLGGLTGVIWVNFILPAAYASDPGSSPPGSVSRVISFVLGYPRSTRERQRDAGAGQLDQCRSLVDHSLRLSGRAADGGRGVSEAWARLC
jgi:hypothetical protein